MKIKGAIAKGKDRWESVGSDPHFEFLLRPVRPAFLIFAVASDPTAGDVQIYFDLGHGYNERDSISTGLIRNTVVCIPLRAIKGTRLRVDPVSTRGEFFFANATVWFTGSLSSSLKKFRHRNGLDESISLKYCSPDDIMFGDKPLLKDLGSYFRAKADRSSSHGLRAMEEPTLSFVVPVYNCKRSNLDALIKSVFEWRRDGVELILSDDGSTSQESVNALTATSSMPANIQVIYHQNTGYGGAVNRGVKAAKGKWVGIIDHDDLLTAGAVDRLLAAILSFGQAKMFYTDELIVGKNGKIVDIMAKPAFDPVLLSGVNYVNHLSIYERSRFLDVGGMRSGFRGSQDYDLVLRYTDGLQPEEIVHIPFPAYIWRREGATFSKTYLDECTSSAREALSEHYSAIGKISFQAALQPDYHKMEVIQPSSGWPSVSIVISGARSDEEVLKTVAYIADGTDYGVTEIIIPMLEGMSDDFGSRRYASRIPIKIFDWRTKAAVGAISFGADNASAEYIVILATGVRPTTSNWLRELVSCAFFPNVGVVAPRCIDEDGLLKNGGLVCDNQGSLLEWFKRQPIDFAGGLGVLQLRHTVSAVSSQCVLIARNCFSALGLPTEVAAGSWAEDFCLRAHAAGYRSIWTPEATVVEQCSSDHCSEDDIINRDTLNSNGLSDKYASPWYNLRGGRPLISIDNPAPTGRTDGLG